MTHLPLEGIDHGISNEINSGSIYPDLPEVFTCRFGSREEIVRNTVCYDPIDLFRHVPVPTADPALHMCDFGLKLLGDDGAGHCRCHITDNHDNISRVINQVLLKTDHDRSGLCCLRSATGGKVCIRLRNT